MKRRQKGAALGQYALLIGLIALTVVLVCIAFGNQIGTNLYSYLNQYTNMNSQISTNTQKEVTASPVDTNGTAGVSP